MKFWRRFCLSEFGLGGGEPCASGRETPIQKQNLLLVLFGFASRGCVGFTVHLRPRRAASGAPAGLLGSEPTASAVSHNTRAELKLRGTDEQAHACIIQITHLLQLQRSFTSKAQQRNQ